MNFREDVRVSSTGLRRFSPILVTLRVQVSQVIYLFSLFLFWKFFCNATALHYLCVPISKIASRVGWNAKDPIMIQENSELIFTNCSLSKRALNLPSSPESLIDVLYPGTGQNETKFNFTSLRVCLLKSLNHPASDLSQKFKPFFTAINFFSVPPCICAFCV